MSRYNTGSLGSVCVLICAEFIVFRVAETVTRHHPSCHRHQPDRHGRDYNYYCVLSI